VNSFNSKNVGGLKVVEGYLMVTTEGIRLKRVPLFSKGIQILAIIVAPCFPPP
jgi:hypothetical protein